MAYQSVTLPEFQGLNEDENPSSLLPGQLREAINCSRKGRMTGTRPGIQYDGNSDYRAAIPGTPAVQGLHEYRRAGGATRDLVCVAGGNVYVDDTSGALTKTGVTITAGQNNYWTFDTYQDKVFAAGGANGDSFWAWDGTGSLTNIALSFDVKYVFSKWNFLFLGGLNGTTAADNPLVARYCNYATDATDPTNWNAANTIPGQNIGDNPGPGSYGQEYNTGFGLYQDNRGDFLLFLTNKRIVAMRQNPNNPTNTTAFIQTDSVATGCVAQDAFVDLGFDQGDAVYVSEVGVHSMALSQQYGDRVTDFLSWPIRKTWETINRSRLKYIKAAYWPVEGLVLFLVSTGSSITHDLCLCMDIKDADRISPDTVRWYKWRISGMTPNLIRPARDADGKPYIYFCGTAGEVAQMNRSVFSDLGSLYAVSFRTKDEDYGVPASEKAIGDSFFAMQGRGTYSPSHQYVVDDGNKVYPARGLSVPRGGAVFGTAVFGTDRFGTTDSTVRDRVRGAGSGYTISHRFSHAGLNQPFWVGTSVQDIAITGHSDEASA